MKSSIKPIVWLGGLAALASVVLIASGIASMRGDSPEAGVCEALIRQKQAAISGAGGSLAVELKGISLPANFFDRFKNDKVPVLAAGAGGTGARLLRLKDMSGCPGHGMHPAPRNCYRVTVNENTIYNVAYDGKQWVPRYHMEF